jgi:hypothetical protein
MSQHPRIFIVFIALLSIISSVSIPPETVAGAETLPAQLSDREFWRIIEEFSEPNGYFRSDNLLSNEIWFQNVIPELVQRTRTGGAYLGVGPEQNFTYIAALKPKIAFITDIRRGNLHLQLMYKALFELSDDRAGFVSRLFTKKRPDGLDRSSTAQEIFDAYWNVHTGEDAVFKENLKAIHDLLAKKHGFPLSADDLAGIEYAYHNFYTFGPAINYNSSSRSTWGQGGSEATYADLMTQQDRSGVRRSYLASEENFRLLKDLEEKNLIIPLVGDFAGPKAIRAVGKYLRDHDATVAAFYLSNVEGYLGDLWNTFCASVASLPLDEKSTFIRSMRSAGGAGSGFASSLGAIRAETKACSGI